MDKEKLKDVGYAITKAGLGSIPIAGAAASELLSLLVASPLEKRRTKWMIEIGEKLKELEQKGEVNLEMLSENPVFVDIVLQATQLALKTGEQEKINIFKSVIINNAKTVPPEVSETQIFLNLISSFTVWHIRILKLFDNPTDWFKIRKIEIPNFMAAGLSSILEIAYPKLKGRSEFYNLIWDDLSRAGLHKSGSLQTMMSSSGLTSNRTTEFGKKFLCFIENIDRENNEN